MEDATLKGGKLFGSDFMAPSGDFHAKNAVKVIISKMFCNFTYFCKVD